MASVESGRRLAERVGATAAIRSGPAAGLRRCSRHDEGLGVDANRGGGCQWLDGGGTFPAVSIFRDGVGGDGPVAVGAVVGGGEARRVEGFWNRISGGGGELFDPVQLALDGVVVRGGAVAALSGALLGGVRGLRGHAREAGEIRRAGGEPAGGLLQWRGVGGAGMAARVVVHWLQLESAGRGVSRIAGDRAGGGYSRRARLSLMWCFSKRWWCKPRWGDSGTAGRSGSPHCA